MCLLPAIFFFFWEKVNSGKRRFLATERFSPTTWSGKFCLYMGAMYKWMVIHVHKTWWRKGLQDMVLPLIITPVTRWHRSASLAWSLILQHWGILTLFWYCALTSVLLLYKIVKDSDKMRIFSMKIMIVNRLFWLTALLLVFIKSETQKSWDWKGLLGPSDPTPCSSRDTKTSCLGPRPGSFWRFPRTKTPPPLWATYLND